MQSILRTCLALAASLVCAGAEATTVHRSTSAGQPVRVGAHASFTEDCRGSPVAVTVVNPPLHGTVSTRPETTTLSRNEAGSARCAGSRTAATSVIYQPETGFRGADRLSYTTTSPSGAVLTHEAAISVR